MVNLKQPTRSLISNCVVILGLFLSLSSYANNVIKIGLDADLSAVAKEGGIAIQRGASLAIDEINATGGILGKQLQLVVKDHKGNPARGIHNLKKFSEDSDVVAILGGVHTPVVMQELELIHQQKIPFLIPWAAGTSLVDNNYQPNFVFRVSVRDEQAAHVMLRHAQQHGHTKIALLLEQTGWGRSNYDSMNKVAIALGLEIGHVAWFNWRQPSMLNELKRIKQSGSTAVMLVANAPEGAIIIKQAASNEYSDLEFVSHWGLTGGPFVKKVGLDALKKVKLAVLQTYSFSEPSNLSLNKRVLQAYQLKYADENLLPEAIPGAVGVAHAYDLVHILGAAIKQAHTTNREQVRNELERVPSVQGLVKQYAPPFSIEQHDALLADDYMMSGYNEQGHLVPIKDVEK